MIAVALAIILLYSGSIGLLSALGIAGIEKFAQIFWFSWEVFMDLPFYLKLLTFEFEFAVIGEIILIALGVVAYIYWTSIEQWLLWLGVEW